jgi:hypothetical protein
MMDRKRSLALTILVIAAAVAAFGYGLTQGGTR